MTDNEIIKAFEICESTSLGCVDCPYYSRKADEKCLPNLMRDVLDLINRQQAEIAELKEKNSGLALGLLYEVVNEDEQLRNEITKVAVSEAYKECIEKVRELGKGVHPCSDELRIFDSDLDNLLKEMGCE